MTCREALLEFSDLLRVGSISLEKIVAQEALSSDLGGHLDEVLEMADRLAAIGIELSQHTGTPD